MSLVILLAVITFVLSIVSVDYVRQHLRKQLLDIPNERSSHKQPIPRGGGLGFIAAALLGLCLYPLMVSDVQMIPVTLWLTLLPLIAVSLVDDWKTLKARTRYIIQLSVAACIVAQTGPFPQPWLTQSGTFGTALAFGLTVVGLTAFVNFYNFMDGLDGLVAGVSIVQLSFCAIMLHQPVLWILVAAVLGFFRWNWAPAKIFMGDAGSTVLGAVIAMTLLYGATHRLSNSTGLAWSYLTITLPLVADAIYTLMRRISRRENIFQAHCTHLYQRMNQLGWSHAKVAATYIFAELSVITSLMFLGEMGAWLSLFSIIIAIVQCERYLSLPEPAPANAQIPYRSRAQPTLAEKPDQ